MTFDLVIYMKAKQIQWRYPEEFADVIIRMGGFHIALNYLGLMGKKYLDSGLDDLLIESGVYAAALMKGKACKLVSSQPLYLLPDLQFAYNFRCIPKMLTTITNIEAHSFRFFYNW